PSADQEFRSESAISEEAPRPANTLPAAAGSPGVSRRFSGGLPSWLLAEAGAEPAGEATPAETESSNAPTARECEPARNDVDLNDDQSPPCLRTWSKQSTKKPRPRRKPTPSLAAPFSKKRRKKRPRPRKK